MTRSHSPSLCEIRRIIGDCLNDVDGTAGIAAAMNDLSSMLYSADGANPKGISTLISLLEDKLRDIHQELSQLREQL